MARLGRMPLVSGNDFHIEFGELKLGGLTLPNGLRVRSVAIEATGISANPEQGLLRWPKGGGLVVSLTLEDVQAFVNRERPGGLRDYEVISEPPNIVVVATRPGLIPIRVQAVCRLAIHEGSAVHLELLSAHALRANVSGFVGSAIQKANPLFSASDLPFDSTLLRLEVDNWGIQLVAEVKPGSYPE